MITLNSRSLVFWLSVVSCLMILIQVTLGSSLIALTLNILALLVGLYGFLIVGVYNVGAWVLLIYLLGNILVALFGKTVMGQALDTNLVSAVDSFFAITITCISMTAALLLVHRLKVGRPLFRAIDKPHLLNSISWGSFFLGIFFTLLDQVLQDGSDSSFGGFAVFGGFLQMAVIARTAVLMEETQLRHSFDIRLGVMILVGFSLGMLDNSKTSAVLPVISYFATVLFYRGGIKLRHLLIAVMIGLVFSATIAPMIHILRGLGQQQLDVEQRVSLVFNTMMTLVRNPDELARSKKDVISNFGGGYYRYFGDNGVGQMILGRYTSVQQIDPVIAEVNRQGSLGGEAIWSALPRLLPRFIYPDKPKYTESFNTLVHYRLVEPLGGKFPTLPLAGQVYAAYGIVGLFLIPFFVYLFFFAALKKVGWQLGRNIFAIFFLCNFVVTYASQGDFGQYIGTMLRNFPLFLMSFWLLSKLSRYRNYFRLR